MRTHHRPLVKVDLLGPAINRQSGWMFTGFLRLKKALEQKFRGRENPTTPNTNCQPGRPVLWQSTVAVARPPPTCRMAFADEHAKRRE